MSVIKTLVGVVVVAAAAAGGLQLSDHFLTASDARQSPAGQQAPLAVETIAVGTATFSDRIRAVGTARARHALTLVPEAGGRIARIAFQPGMQVEAGDLLLELDDRAEQADLKAAEATLTETTAAFDRQQQLNNSGSASDATFQTARAALLRAEAERDRARAALDDRSLRAPFSGVVGLTDLVEGQMVEPATEITTLDDLSVIEIDFSVSETMLPRLRNGQQVRLTTAAWPDRVFDGTLSRIDTRVDAATRSIALRAAVGNDDRALAGGMFLQVELLMNERERPALPERALRVEGARNMVLLAQDGVAREVEVTTGQQVDGFVEVLAGVQPGAQIIVTNLHRVEPDMAIAATPQDAPLLEATAARAPGADG